MGCIAMKQKIFTAAFLEEVGFTFSKGDENSQYGEAISKRPKGMTILNWNNEGHFCTYFGDKLPENVSLYIGKDGGTRTAFNGYVFNQDQVRLLLELTN